MRSTAALTAFACLFLLLWQLFLVPPCDALPKPKDWSESDWYNAIDLTVQTGIGQFAPTPVMEMYSALSASPAALKVGLNSWLDGKMANALQDNTPEGIRKFNRYYAFKRALNGDPEGLKELDQQIKGKVPEKSEAPINKELRVTASVVKLDSYRYRLVGKWTVYNLRPGDVKTVNIAHGVGTESKTLEFTAFHGKGQGTFEEDVDIDRPGHYIWRVRGWLPTSPEVDEVKIALPFDVDIKDQSKWIAGSASLDKTDGQVGDTYTFTIDYQLHGIPLDGSVVVTEKSTITENDSSFKLPLPAGTSTVTSASPRNVKSFTFRSSKAGIFEWSAQISAPDYGLYETQRMKFIVRPAPAIQRDSESVQPTDAKETQFNLKVDYRLKGMSATDSQTVTEESNITDSRGAVVRTFPRKPVTISGTSPYGHMDLNWTGTAPGPYVWNYTIDGGTYGTLRGALAFRVQDNTKRYIQLVWARVLPSQGPVGRTFTLAARYRLVGLDPGATVQTAENDYVNFGGKTETHQTNSSTVTDRNPEATLNASFTPTQSGRHVWNFTVDAPGFSTLYNSMGFEVIGEEKRHQIRASLEFPMVTLAPGETKNCSIYISGYRGNTADRVECVYPQIMDGWGTLPGQIQVFPGNTSMDPSSMRGIGDYTKQYALGQGYRARETAPPGVTPVKIIIRQKDAGEVVLTLMVKVVKRGENTMGTEVPMFPPRVPEDGSSGNGPGGGTGGPGGGSGGPGGGSGGPGGGGGGPGGGTGGPGGTDGGGGGTGGPGSGGTGGPGGGGGTTNRTGGGTDGGGGPSDGGGGTTDGGTGGSDTTGGGGQRVRQAVYEFADVRFRTWEVDGGGENEVTLKTASGTVPLEWETSKYGGTETGQCSLSYTFPQEILLKLVDPNSYTYRGELSGQFEGSAQINHTAVTSPPEVGLIVLGYKGVTSRDTKRDMKTGTFSTSRSWKAEKGDCSGLTSDQDVPPAEASGSVDGDHAVQFVSGGRGIRLFSARYSLKKGQPSGRLKAWLDKSLLVLVPGKLPSEIDNINIKDWISNTANPVEVIFPGQTFGNMLPNEIGVDGGGGSQDPSALNAVISKDNTYSWSEIWRATNKAKPGTYQIPIIVRQQGAGEVRLVLTVKIVPKVQPGRPPAPPGTTALPGGLPGTIGLPTMVIREPEPKLPPKSYVKTFILTGTKGGAFTIDAQVSPNKQKVPCTPCPPQSTTCPPGSMSH